MRKFKPSRFISRWIVDRPWYSLGLVLILLLVTLPGLRHFSEDYRVSVWFSTDDPYLKGFNEFESDFGSDESAVLVIHHEKSVFNPQTIALIQELTKALWKTEGIVRVESLTNFNWIEASEEGLSVGEFIPKEASLSAEYLSKKESQALRSKLMKDYMVSADGTHAMIHAFVQPSFGGDPPHQTVVRGMKRLMKENELEGHTFYLSGNAPLWESFREVTNRDMLTIFPISSLLMGIVLLILFRNLCATLVPLMVVGMSIAVALGIGFGFGIRITNMTAALPGILTAICIADSMHVLSYFFRYRKQGMLSKDAARMSLTENFKPTLMTTLSTAIGFLSLCLADLVPQIQLGFMAGVGSMVAWFLTYFLLGPSLVLLSYPIRKKEEGQLTFFTRLNDRWSHGSGVLVDFMFKKNKIFLRVFFVLTVLFLGLAFSNQINMDPYSYFSKKIELRRAYDYLLEEVGGIGGPEIVLKTGDAYGIQDPEFLKKVEHLQIWLEKFPFVTKTISVLDIIKNINQNLMGGDKEEYRIPDSRKAVAEELLLYTMGLPFGMDLNNRLNQNYDSMRFQVFWTLRDSKSNLKWIGEIEQKLKELGLEGDVTGTLTLYHRMDQRTVKTFIKSLSLALVMIAFLMVLSLNSIPLGFLSMLPNVVPLVFAGALMTIRGTMIDVGTVLVIAVCFGIAVDDTIHFLSHYGTNKNRGMAPIDNVKEVFKNIIPALFFTTLLLVVGFGIFFISDYMPIHNFGVLCAIVFIVALVADILFLPALLFWLEKNQKKDYTLFPTPFKFPNISVKEHSDEDNEDSPPED